MRLFFLVFCLCAAAAAAAQSPPAPPKPPATGAVSRWFELQPSSLGLRYRFIDNGTSASRTNQLQHRQQFQGRVKLDRGGRFSLYGALRTGNSFISSWNNTGLGTGNTATNIRLDQLFASVRPVAGLEVQYGGMSFVRGEGTEITTFDNDAYLVGERVSLKRPTQLWFDEVTVTFGYLGDLNRPNLNKRFNRLKRSNYHQFLVVKRIGRSAVSGEYTFLNGAEFLRQALRLALPRNGVLESIRMEQYQRLDAKPDYGFAISGERALNRRVSMVGGVSRVDPDYGPLNGDRYTTGSRVFLGPTWKVASEWTISSFVTRTLTDRAVQSNRIRFDLIVSYDLTRGLTRSGLLR